MAFDYYKGNASITDDVFATLGLKKKKKKEDLPKLSLISIELTKSRAQETLNFVGFSKNDTKGSVYRTH